MKRIFILLMLVFSLTSIASADEMQVNALTIGQGQKAQLEVALNNPDLNYAGFQFLISLPEGVSVAQDENSAYLIEKGDRLSALNVSIDMEDKGNNTFFVLFYQTKTSAFPGTSGVVAKITLQASAELTVGVKLTGTLTEIQMSDTESNSYNLEDVSFAITIGEPADPRTILDENSTTAPTAASNVDIRVKRTINANSWSTICLPFAMTEAQTKAVFGNDVELAEFTGADSEFDGDNVVGIKVNFSSVSSIAANTPYIIKVSSAVSEFTMDGVDITPEEDEAYIEFDNGKTGSRRVVYSGFYGTYHAETPLDEYTVFLSGGKFWYSMGETKMKGYRAYFSFLDILTEVENASVKMFVDLGGEETGIGNVNVNDSSMIYDLSGRRVSKTQKGVYIVNGKKVMK